MARPSTGQKSGGQTQRRDFKVSNIFKNVVYDLFTYKDKLWRAGLYRQGLRPNIHNLAKRLLSVLCFLFKLSIVPSINYLQYAICFCYEKFERTGKDSAMIFTQVNSKISTGTYFDAFSIHWNCLFCRQSISHANWCSVHLQLIP